MRDIINIIDHLAGTCVHLIINDRPTSTVWTKFILSILFFGYNLKTYNIEAVDASEKQEQC